MRRHRRQFRAIAGIMTVGILFGAAGCDSTTDVDVGDIDWFTAAIQYRAQIGSTYSFRCPPDGTLGALWGTDIYTDDSSICTAGVHAGRITREQGGRVTIEILPGQSSYQGSTRNGVTSANWGPWDGSFSVR